VDAPDEPDEDVAAAEEGSSSTSGKDGAQRKGRTAAGVASSALDIVSAVCERFKEQGDALSLVVLAESAARVRADVGGPSHLLHHVHCVTIVLTWPYWQTINRYTSAGWLVLSGTHSHDVKRGVGLLCS
jgi:hypothetical protein